MRRRPAARTRRRPRRTTHSCGRAPADRRVGVHARRTRVGLCLHCKSRHGVERPSPEGAFVWDGARQPDGLGDDHADWTECPLAASELRGFHRKRVCNATQASNGALCNVALADVPRDGRHAGVVVAALPHVLFKVVALFLRRESGVHGVPTGLPNAAPVFQRLVPVQNCARQPAALQGEGVRHALRGLCHGRVGECVRAKIWGDGAALRCQVCTMYKQCP